MSWHFPRQKNTQRVLPINTGPTTGPSIDKLKMCSKKLYYLASSCLICSGILPLWNFESRIFPPSGGEGLDAWETLKCFNHTSLNTFPETLVFHHTSWNTFPEVLEHIWLQTASWWMYEARCGRTAGFEEMHGNQGLRSSLARCKKEEAQ